MDIVNDLSSDVALAVFVEGRLSQKLDAEDAKSFIARVEAELSRIFLERLDRDSEAPSPDLSH